MKNESICAKCGNDECTALYPVREMQLCNYCIEEDVNYWKDRYGKLADALKEVVYPRRCSDHGCIWGHPGGMGTNGGCGHDKMSLIELRVEMRGIAKVLRELVKE